MSNIEIPDSILRYETFINDVLKEDLKKLDLRMDAIVKEIAEFTQQKHMLNIVCDKASFPDGFKTQVDVGCNFYLEAKVTDTSAMLFNIGLDHYLEFTKAEADRFIDAKMVVLEKGLEDLKQKSAETKAHIKLMLFGIGQLQNLITKDGSR